MLKSNCLRKKKRKMNKSKKPLIRIVDDEALVRRALRFLLESEGWEVADYGTAREFLINDRPSLIGCIIMDIAMPQMSGEELFRELRERDYEVPVIFLTGHGDIDMAVRLMKHGAVDFIQKPVDEDRLLVAVAKAVEYDETHRGWTIDLKEEKKRFKTLTPREQEVLHLVASGLINKEIGERLGLSERTVEVHRQNGSRKLGLQSASDISRLFSHLADE